MTGLWAGWHPLAPTTARGWCSGCARTARRAGVGLAEDPVRMVLPTAASVSSPMNAGCCSTRHGCGRGPAIPGGEALSEIDRAVWDRAGGQTRGADSLASYHARLLLAVESELAHRVTRHRAAGRGGGCGAGTPVTPLPLLIIRTPSSKEGRRDGPPRAGNEVTAGNGPPREAPR